MKIILWILFSLALALTLWMASSEAEGALVLAEATPTMSATWAEATPTVVVTGPGHEEHRVWLPDVRGGGE